MIKRFLPYIVFILIIATGAFLRLYRISDYMSFLGDEGRDALVVKRIIVDHKYTLLGPITSVGLMHLGPMYYYFMIPFLWVTNLDPVGPAIMVALFSLGTIFLIWKIGQEFFDTTVAAVASLLYALSPFVIIHAHSSWNPNILPFWATLLIYSLLQIYVKQKPRWLFVTGLTFGIAIQLHYVALVFLPITLVALFLSRKALTRRHWIFGFIGWLCTYSPFILFELKHRFINTITVFQFVTRTGDAKSFDLLNPLGKFWDLTVRLFWRLVVIENAQYSIVFLALVLGISLYLLLKGWYGEKIKQRGLLILFIWYGIGLGLLSFYAGIVFDYYLVFIFPLPFILTGIAASYISQRKLGQFVAILVIVLVSFWEIKQTSILKTPNRIVTQTKEIAQFVFEKTEGRPYNFALMAGKNSDHAYRYFLDVWSHPPVTIEDPAIDPERKSVTDQLLIVCEEKECKPLGYSLWEIAGFGRAEIDNQWQVGLFQVLKLSHYQEEENSQVNLE